MRGKEETIEMIDNKEGEDHIPQRKEAATSGG
jgi:hypothetical protein